MTVEGHRQSRQHPVEGRALITGVKANKVYTEGRTCVECDAPISRYNKHKTCWAHTPVEKYVLRGKSKSASV